MADSRNDTNEQNAEDYSSIDISDGSRLIAASIKGRLDSVSPSPFGKSCCIYRVHDKFRKLNEYAYTPEMVSIGPFHRGKVALQAMEDHKLRYMNSLLNRMENPKAKLEECVEVIRRVEDEARKCYSESIDLDKDKFTQMLTVDGLFIIELFLKCLAEETKCDDDPVFNNIWGMSSLVRDLILLENQLPMLVLENLFKRTIANQCNVSLNEIAIRFFNPLMHRNEDVLQRCFNKEGFSKQGKHLLDLLSKTFHDFTEKPNNNNLKLKHIPCVTELRRAGVKFKVARNAGSFLDIKFINGVLEIPPILIQDQTDSLLRNLIASEQCCDGRATHITSYAFLMDSLINSPNDAGFLRSRGVFTSYLGEDECISSIFNKLCNEVTLVNFCYSDLCDQVNAFYRTRWHVWKATLKKDYFQSPWAVASVVAAGLLIFLTLTATIFSILSFAIHES